MKNISKIVKYQYRDLKMGVIVFYSVIIAIIIMMTISAIVSKSGVGGAGGFFGFGISTAIFFFILGLNMFRGSFEFMMVNNISRKAFYQATLLTFVTISIFMAAIDVSLSIFLRAILPYKSLFEQLYSGNIFTDFIWSLSLYISIASIGWVITMLYYRLDKLMKAVISIIPVFLLMMVMGFETIIGGVVKPILDFIAMALGLSSSHNFLIAVFSFTICTTVFMIINYLLIRRIPIKG